MLTSVKLVDGAREMILLPRRSQGVRFQELDAPMPDVREVTEARTDDDGERDSTELHGARACSIELLVTQSPGAVEDELTRYLHPRSRPYLVVEDDEWTQARRLRLRVSQFTAPRKVDLPRRMRRLQAQWKVPDGIWEADALAGATVNADVSESSGLAFPIAFPVAWAPTTATGAYTLTNLGSIPSHFVARLYGPCTAPSLINETTGEQLTFTSGLSLGVGEYVEVNTRDRTAYLLSMASASRLNHIDFENTSWWRIEPGDQQIRYAPEDSSGGAAAVIEYRPAWL